MTLPDDLLQIDTPENVAFGYEVAGIGSRFLAALVDTLIIGVLEALVYLTIFLVAYQLSTSNVIPGGEGLGTWLVAIGFLVAFAFLWGYYIFFEMLWNGQTPGKRMASLRVLRSDGSPITMVESAIRNLVRVVDFLPSFYGLGIIVMFVDERSRRLGDMAAGTLVVRDRGQVTLDSLEKMTKNSDLKVSILSLGSQAAQDSSLDSLPIERLTPADLQAAEEFIRRRVDLFNRVQLSRHIAASLAARMDLGQPPEKWEDCERLINQVVLAARLKDRG